MAGALGGDDGDDARHAARFDQIHDLDAALGDGRTDDITMGAIGRCRVLLVRIWCCTGGLQGAIDTIDRLTDDVELVDPIGGSRSGEFHDVPFFACASVAASVRWTSVILNALSGIVLAPASK